LNAVWLERSKDPISFDMRLAYLIRQGAFKGDFTKIGKVAASKSMEELEGLLKTSGKHGFTPDTQVDTKTKDVDKNIKDLEGLFNLSSK
jgi:ribosomal protein L1